MIDPFMIAPMVTRVTEALTVHLMDSLMPGHGSNSGGSGRREHQRGAGEPGEPDEAKGGGEDGRDDEPTGGL